MATLEELTDRIRHAAASGGQPDQPALGKTIKLDLKGEGFEASVHKIKEQVLPRLLERVDPEAAATLSKD